MQHHLTKIPFYLGFILLLCACNVVKRVPENEYLLTENTLEVDGEITTEFGALSQISQKPNSTLPVVKIPIGLHIYNIAEPHPDSTFTAWLNRKPNRKKRLTRLLSEKQLVALENSKIGFNSWLKKTGDAPIIISEAKTNKSVQRLIEYYKSFGYFNTTATAQKINDSTKNKRAQIIYSVNRARPYIIDSITTSIASPVIDTLFNKTKKSTFIKKGKQYNANDFVNERDRLTIEFRNSGVYHFEEDYITFVGDTVKTEHKANMRYEIENRKIEQGDSTITAPFKIYNVNKVKIVTDYGFENRNRTQFTDSTSINGYQLFSYDKLKFKPKAITDAISITPNAIFKDVDRTLTYNQISDLKIFKYPNISYEEDPLDPEQDGLIATILLTPREKYTLDASFDTYTSVVQQFGVGFSGGLVIRNIFRRAETLEISGRGSIGSSNDVADTGRFFNISEVGTTVKLSFPRIVSPFNTDPFIPKYKSPSTNISAGFGVQTNIGLDRQTADLIYNYTWKPSKKTNYSFDLLNIQFVRNVNPDNYYEVYRSSFNRLNEIAREVNYNFINDGANPTLSLPSGGDNFNEANFFIENVLNNNLPEITITEELLDEVQSIGERQLRLTENNLIVASNITWTYDTRESLFDLDFSRLRIKLESAGNLLSLATNSANTVQNSLGQRNLFDVAFSQYGKIDTEYIKHWAMGNNSVFATRAFIGVAIPYGNSNSIPFTRSYFAGGANDNRGWRPYDLGPGSSGSVLDFNEANFKLAFNGEYRFDILGAIKGAFFVDAGNIWNLLDDVDNPSFAFNGLEDLDEIAVATGFGLRYDFDFFVIRLDTGFKTHDPSLEKGNRWLTNFKVSEAVFNIGINYPF